MSDDAGLADDQERAFALLSEVGERCEADDGDAAAHAAGALGDLLARRPADATRAGFGAMALDAALALVGAGRDVDALALCDVIVARLDDGSDPDRAVAAGARFLAAQAAGRLGEAERSRRLLESLATMGDPALAGLERMAGRLAAAGAPAAWHAQVAAATATILWRAGRLQEARTFARETAASLERLGEPALAARLQALATELGG